ncbi:hypothetical protein BC833DRAFT_562983 [Globomyces pollinis-pini]|nr:hypothetical protein BC833DRAFT_562983 [Globomyces pollinis-pini]
MQFINMMLISTAVSAAVVYQECYDSAKKFRVGIVFKDGRQCKYTNNSGTWAACSTYGKWCGDDDITWNCDGERVRLVSDCSAIAFDPRSLTKRAVLRGIYSFENGCDKYYFG